MVYNSCSKYANNSPTVLTDMKSHLKTEMQARVWMEFMPGNCLKYKYSSSPTIPTQNSEYEPCDNAEPPPHHPPSLHGGHQVHWYPIQADQQLRQDEVHQEQVVVLP